MFGKHYWKLFAACSIIFVASYPFPSHLFFLPANLNAVSFALLVVLITMRIRIENRPLKWFGKNLFPLYIYQRIPMIALLAVADGRFVAEHEYVYAILSFAITILIAYGYKYIAIKDVRLFRLLKRA